MPVCQCVSVEKVSHPVGDVTSSVIAFINNKGLLVPVGVHSVEQFLVPVGGCVGHMNVAYPSSGKLVDHCPTFVHPVEVSEFQFTSDRFYCVCPGSVRGWFGIDFYLNRFFCLVFKEDIWIYRSRNILSVDAYKVITLFYIDTHFGKRRPPGIIPVFALEYF